MVIFHCYVNVHQRVNQNVTRNTLMLFHAMLAGFLPFLGRWKLIKSYHHCILAGERVNFSCLKNIMLHQLIQIIMFSWFRSRSFGIANLGYPDTLQTSQNVTVKCPSAYAFASKYISHYSSIHGLLVGNTHIIAGSCWYTHWLHPHRFIGSQFWLLNLHNSQQNGFISQNIVRISPSSHGL